MWSLGTYYWQDGEGISVDYNLEREKWVARPPRPKLITAIMAQAIREY